MCLYFQFLSLSQVSLLGLNSYFINCDWDSDFLLSANEWRQTCWHPSVHPGELVWVALRSVGLRHTHHSDELEEPVRFTSALQCAACDITTSHGGDIYPLGSATKY